MRAEIARNWVLGPLLADSDGPRNAWHPSRDVHPSPTVGKLRGRARHTLLSGLYDLCTMSCALHRRVSVVNTLSLKSYQLNMR